MHRRVMGIAPIAVVLLAGMFAAGCGSSSSSTSTETTAAISKAEFVSKGNAICAAAEKTQEAEFTAYGKKVGLSGNQEPTTAQQAQIVETIFAPSVQSQITAIKALGAPSGEEQQVSSALEAAQQSLSKVEAEPELAFSPKAFAAAGKQLHALGLTKCAPNS
jgi:hypothetical protein